MRQEQTIADFLSFARRQVELLATQLRKETDKFQEYLDWETTVRSIEQGLATGSNSALAYRSSPAVEVLGACKAIMEDRIGPIPIRHLLEALKERGIRISGTQPIRNLSSKLSTSALFESTPLGWMLASNISGNGEQERRNHQGK